MTNTANMTNTALLTAIFCALQEGDFQGILPGALLQDARIRTMSAEDAEWLRLLDRAWSTQNGYARCSS
ncbi:MAG: hypothetical protein GY871_14920 [Actinomycetales bacterium]|jgi:hypothetical protein|nr:hypothetical protein [Actinomycetales bacterium]